MKSEPGCVETSERQLSVNVFMLSVFEGVCRQDLGLQTYWLQWGRGAQTRCKYGAVLNKHVFSPIFHSLFGSHNSTNALLIPQTPTSPPAYLSHVRIANRTNSDETRSLELNIVYLIPGLCYTSTRCLLPL